MDIITALLEIVGMLAIGFGVVFSTLGVIGVFRLPDVYARLHASGKVSTLGVFGILLGTALLVPDAAFKLIALAIFLIISSPAASHAIGLAAYRSGVRMQRAYRDDLGGQFIEPADE